jgi:two-component system KDP operon response regulator KdpE
MMRHQRILVIDDELTVVRLVQATLLNDGYTVVTASSGEEALPLLKKERLDLVILDLMMPGMDGFETLRRIRQRSTTPVIVLTARATDADMIKGFHGGADDYINKPFNPDELSVRVKAVLHRSAGGIPAGGRTTLRYPGVEIDLDRRRVIVGGSEARLSRTEWALLEQLAVNAGRVMHHGELLSRIWGPEFRNEPSYLRTWISRLRTKLKLSVAGDTLITTFPGIGYRLEQPSD